MTLWIPPGWHIEETDTVVDHRMVELYPFKWFAKKRCAQKNALLTAPTMRWEVEKTPKKVKQKALQDAKAEGAAAWIICFLSSPFSTWAVVPYQNVLEQDA